MYMYVFTTCYTVPLLSSLEQIVLCIQSVCTGMYLINNPFPFRQCGEWAGVSRTGGHQLCSADDQLPAAEENGSQTADSASSLGR